jgi:hypothetical protein
MCRGSNPGGSRYCVQRYKTVQSGRCWYRFKGNAIPPSSGPTLSPSVFLERWQGGAEDGVESFRTTEAWSRGLVVSWSPGLLVPWSPGPLVPWSPGLLVSWSPGLLVSWSPGLGARKPRQWLSDCYLSSVTMVTKEAGVMYWQG